MNFLYTRFLFLATAGIVLHVTTAQADFASLHVGRDSLATLTTGTYSGLANPNHDRLTLLRFNSQEVTDPATSHWHSIGVYSYTGAVTSPMTNSTNGNNRIPEPFTNFAPLNLHPGSGAFAGKLVSGIADTSPQSQEDYDLLEMRPVHELADGAIGTVESFLYNSSGGRWKTPLGSNARIALELVEITPGLQVSTADGISILSDVGSRHPLGTGDDWAFTPVLFTDGQATAGKYSASLKLVDLAAGLKDSGTFHFDFQVVPEPGTVSLATLFCSIVLLRARRHAAVG